MELETFRVVPAVPPELGRLRELAGNLLWSWDEELRAIFPRLDRELWDRSEQNPVLMLGLISQQRLDELARDDGFRSLYDRVCRHFTSYLEEATWWDKRCRERPLIAYFSAEFGVTECLPVYSGGLGVLAAHHLKSASDLGVPLVGVGLLYQQGYFRQYLTPDGWQQESYRTNDFFNLPIEPVTGADGAPVRVTLSMAGQALVVQVWRATVGRLPLYLLDTNLPENPKALQDITDQLYGGDHDTRIRQEIVLGIGGLRALHEMGLEPIVCHMNEGHSAFLSIERIRHLMRRHGVTFREALEATRAGGVFTTHTPVPAGFDTFTPALIDTYFADLMTELGVSRREFLALGRPPGDEEGPFNMAALALRTSAFVNGVSRLHGQVSRRMLRRYTPHIPEAEIPVGHVTNGAHTRSCVSREMAGLFDRYLGPEWWRNPGDASTWRDVDNIPDEELWATHERRRERLVAFARTRLARQLAGRGASARDVERARGVLSTRALTVGFARRFATYKRATLLLKDVERLGRILLDAERPVQFIFAGKAHPRDNEGKEMLKAVVAFCNREEFRRHAVFLEDYDLVVARYLVQGVDVWLNTPRRGQEASGTSGMKVLPNGGLNVSILDGWWCEGYEPGVGWAIGKGEDYEDHAYQDAVESSALYELLEKEIVPLFYSRQADGLPRAWIARMKESMKRLSPLFSTNRMLGEYTEHYYRPAAEYFSRLSANGLERARALAAWRDRVWHAWRDVKVESVEALDGRVYRIGDEVDVEGVIRLGSLAPADVTVEVYCGAMSSTREITDGQAIAMTLAGERGPGLFRYTARVPCRRTGLQAFTVRVRPTHPDVNSVLSAGLMTWR